MSFIWLFSGEVLLDLNLLPSDHFQEVEVSSVEISDTEHDGEQQMDDEHIHAFKLIRHGFIF